MAGKKKTQGLSPSGACKLDTLAEVRTEMARLYRLALKETIAPDLLTKLIYALKEIRCCIEAGALEDIQRRLVAIADKVEAQGGR